MIQLIIYIVMSSVNTTSSTTVYNSWDECGAAMDKVIAQNALQGRLAYGQCKEQKK